MIIQNEALLEKRRNTKERANDIFAKIISKEGLILRRSHKARTAQFDPSRRLLILPIFARHAPNFVEEGMIIHEVGHALFTTPNLLTEYNTKLMKKGVPFSFVNIFEDVRINKLMAMRYKGVKAIHNVYYEYLHDSGFFGEKGGKDMNFADKVNVFFKAGKYSGIDIEACPEWAIFGTKILELRTEEDVLTLSLELFEHYKAEAEKRKEEKKKQQEQEEQKEEENKEEESSETADSNEDDSNEDEAEPEANEEDEAESSDEGEPEAGEPETEEAEGEADSPLDAEEEEGPKDLEDDDILGNQNSSTDLDFDEDEDKDDATGATGDTSEGEETDEDENAEESEETLSGAGGEEADTDEDASDEELEANLDSTSNEEFENNMESFVEDEKEKTYKEEQAGKETINTIRIEKDAYKNVFKDFGELLTANFPTSTKYPNYSFNKAIWLPFLAEIKPIVSRMVNDFESKKAAADFARTTTSDSGELDITKLHQYRITDDVFLKNAFTPEGKNHGIVLMVDGSGSMKGNRYVKVIKQAIILSMFAKRVNIPFSVIQFTTRSYRMSGENNVGMDIEDTESEAYAGFKRSLMLELFNSDMKQSTLFDRFEKTYEVAYSYFTQSSDFKRTSNSLEYKRGREVTGSFGQIMGGTPIEASTLMMVDYVHMFKNRNATEINTFVMLTDGGSTGFDYNDSDMNNFKLDLDNLRFHFDSTNKSYEAKYRVSGHSEDLVESALSALKAETGVNIVEIQLDELTWQEMEEIKEKGFIAKHNPRASTDLLIKYQSREVMFANSDHADEAVNEIITAGKAKKVDLMFASLVSNVVAKNM